MAQIARSISKYLNLNEDKEGYTFWDYMRGAWQKNNGMRIDLMIKDLITNTQKNLKRFKIKSYKDIAKSNELIVCFSKNIQSSEKEIKLFLRSNMYDNKSVLRKNLRGKKIIKKLFKIIQSSPRKFLTKEQLTKDKYRAISDFISGMTDRYAINLYNANK